MHESSFPLRPGDHIRVYRGAYYHHGIVVPAEAVWPLPPRLVRRMRREFTARQDRDDFDLFIHVLRAGLAVEVIHYVKDGDDAARLTRTTMPEFVRDSSGVELALAEQGLLPPVEVAHRAEAFLGLGDYFLLDHNCEHFSTWCATGRWASSQVSDVIEVAHLAGWLFRPLQLVALVADLVLSDEEREMPACSACPAAHPWRAPVAGNAADLAVLEQRLRLAGADASAFGGDELSHRLARLPELLCRLDVEQLERQVAYRNEWTALLFGLADGSERPASDWRDGLFPGGQPLAFGSAR